MCSNLLDNAYQNLGSGVHCSSRSDPSLALSTAICTDAIYVYILRYSKSSHSAASNKTL